MRALLLLLLAAAAATCSLAADAPPPPVVVRGPGVGPGLPVPAGSYRAAAVQLRPFYSVHSGGSAAETLRRSVADVVLAVRAASREGAQVAVFSEGVTGMFEASRHNGTVASLRQYCEPRPEAGTVPRGAGALANVSRAAREEGVVVVLNACTSDGDAMYDTAVAFGADGAVLATYRKWNLFSGDFLFNRTAHPDVVSFRAPSLPAVEFGLFVCFDIVFLDPALRLVDAGVRHFLYGTDWINGASTTATQIQRAWSAANGVNLVAANDALCPGHCGGGVYSAGRPLAAYWNRTETLQPALAVADLPVLPPGPPPVSPLPPPPPRPLTGGGAVELFDCGHGELSCAAFNATAGANLTLRAASSHGTVCYAEVKVRGSGVGERWALEAYHDARPVPRSPSFRNETACRLRRCAPRADRGDRCEPVADHEASSTSFARLLVRATGLGFGTRGSTVLPLVSGDDARVEAVQPLYSASSARGGSHTLEASCAPGVTLFKATLEAHMAPLYA